MSIIPISKYVAITSAMANTSAASEKDLIARIFTTNELFAANTVYEFTSSADVGTFAGTNSTEYTLASAYFGWISKTATQAKKISFMRYSFEALAPYMYSTQTLTPLATLKTVTDGSMIINLGGTSYTMSGVNLSEATSYADVATALQTAIQANTDGGELWTAATVTYNAANSAFYLTGGETGANSIGYAETADEGTDLSSLIGWSTSAAPVLSNGTDTQTISDILNKTVALSTNFLTFGFVNAADAYNNLEAIGAWTQEQNYNYRCSFDLGASNYAEGIAISANYSGLTANYNINYGVEGTLPAWLMSCILPATTNYDKTNGVKDYMFQQFDSFPISVGLEDENGTLYQTLDNLCINYNGQTQKSGATIAFYQDGYNTNGIQTATFDNEAWLKDAITTEVINTFLALDYVPADDEGLAIISGILQAQAEKALKNGVFSGGKTLDTTQKAYITQVTGDENAYLNVQNDGYIFSVELTNSTTGSKTTYIASYTLLYLKNDTIHKVEGSDILI